MRRIVILLSSLLVAATLVPASASAADQRFRVATANISKNITDANAREDIEKVAANADVILWQEIIASSRKNMVRDLPGWNSSRLDSYPVPISWRADKWHFVSSGTQKVYDGPPYTDRWVVWTLLEHRDSNTKVRFVNTHFTFGAYTGDMDPARQGAWDAQFAKIKAMIGDWMDGSYWRIIGGGDYNRKDGTPKYAPEQEWFLNGAIDKWFGVNDARLRFVDKISFPQGAFNTDHGPRFAIVEFS